MTLRERYAKLQQQYDSLTAYWQWREEEYRRIVKLADTLAETWEKNHKGNDD